MSLDSADAKNAGAPDSIDITLSPLSDSTWLSPGGPSDFAPIASNFLPGYEIIRELHRGGQGIVYLAIQKSIGREVAIKVMKEGPFADATDRARFDREVHILAQLKHPNIVTIHDSGRIAGCDYFVMDYVAGMSLDEYVAEKKPSLRELLELFIAICETVEVAHARNIIHRDLKPGNIRVDTNGRPRILDFGLAKVVGAPRATNATEQGMFVGSIPWASPEQARGELETLDARTDVYSLGIVLYHQLTNRFPYDVIGPPHEVLRRIITSPPLSLRTTNKGIDVDLETIVLACLAKDRVRRYAGGGKLAADLIRFLRNEPVVARRDGLFYRVRTSATRSIRLRPRISIVCAAALAIAIAHFALRPLFLEWTRVGTAIRQFSLRWLPSHLSGNAEQFDRVRVIAISDGTDIAALAEKEHMIGVKASVPASLRSLHGCLMSRLAIAAPQAVIFDICPRKPSPFDGDFIRGVEALRAKGIDVVVPAPDWKVSEAGLPEISESIARRVRWGCWKADLHADGAWALELVHYRRGEEARGSLALIAAAACRAPLSEASIDLDQQDRKLYLSYWRPDKASTRVRIWSHYFDTIPMFAILRERRAAPEGDIAADDITGMYITPIPRQSELDAITVNYADVFGATPEKLREWFEKRAVIISDQRGDTDRHGYVDGRMIPACYSHAVAIGNILNGAGCYTPSNGAGYAFTALGALAGASLASRFGRADPFARSLLQAGGALVAGTAIVVIICLTAVHFLGYFCSPVVPLSAAWLAAAMTVGVERIRRRGIG